MTTVLLRRSATHDFRRASSQLWGRWETDFVLCTETLGSASNANGGTSEGAVTLGKRFSRNFYAAYERSISGALGTLYVFYDLSQRFTLRAQAGQQSAVDLIYTVPYD